MAKMPSMIMVPIKVRIKIILSVIRPVYRRLGLIISNQEGLPFFEAVDYVFPANKRVADTVFFEQSVGHAAAGAAVAHGVIATGTLQYGMYKPFTVAALHNVFCLLPVYHAVGIQFFGIEGEDVFIHAQHYLCIHRGITVLENGAAGAGTESNGLGAVDYLIRLIECNKVGPVGVAAKEVGYLPDKPAYKRYFGPTGQGYIDPQ